MWWNKSFETGVPLLDTQHQELFRQIDKLTDKAHADSVPQVLNSLGKYFEKHFREEEQLHASTGFQQRMEHKKLHGQFVAGYRKLLDEYAQNPGQRGLMTLRITRTTVDWLRKHIGGPDMVFAKFYHLQHGHAQTKDAWKTDHISAQAMRSFDQDAIGAAFAENYMSDEEVLRRVSTQALADELVRRSTGGGDAFLGRKPKSGISEA